MHVVVIENISHDPIFIGDFVVCRNEQGGLRTRDEDIKVHRDLSEEEHHLFPLGVLRPEEKILFPLSLSFRFSDLENELFNYMRTHSLETKAIVSEVHRLDEVERIAVDDIGPGYTCIIPKDRFVEKFADDEQFEIPVEEYLYGPSWVIEALFVDKTKYLFRQYNPNVLLVFAGYYEGSCPYIYTWCQGENRWTVVNHILYGKLGKRKEGNDEVKIEDFNGRIMIKEIETEISYFDTVYIRIEIPLGDDMIFDASHPALNAQDGIYLILHQGEQLELNFNVPKEYHEQDIFIGATGYYEPAATQSMQQTR